MTINAKSSDMQMIRWFFVTHEEPDEAKFAVEKIVQNLVTSFETHQ